MTALILPLKIPKLISRLSSDSDGEVIATISALRRVLESAGLDFHDLADQLAGGKYEVSQHEKTEPAGWHIMVNFCMEHREFLSDWENKFMSGVLRWKGSITEKQLQKITTIFEDLQEGM
jgi:hypothetical protein